MSLVTPLPGAYVVVSLDPLVTLESLDDPIVKEECQKMRCGKYIACVTRPVDSFGMVFNHCMFKFDLVARGLPADDPANFFHHSMSIPISPNTASTTGRCKMRAQSPLPWDNCYHAFSFRFNARCDVTTSTNYPQSCLCLEDAELLDAYTRHDSNYAQRQILCRAKGQPTIFPPPSGVDPSLQLFIELAEEQEMLPVPWWKNILAGQAADSGVYCSSITSASTPQSPHIEEPASRPAEETVKSFFCTAEVDAIIQALPRSPDTNPFVTFSYDLTSVESPPDPSGLLKELAEIERIKADYESRQERSKHEASEADSVFFSSLEAQGTRVRPRKRIRRCMQFLAIVSPGKLTSIMIHRH
ncbi:hypothetical protein GGG16DRAFT_64840 [Schizophyllum commune]